MTIEALALLRGVNSNPVGSPRWIAYRAALDDLDERLGTPLSEDQKLVKRLANRWKQLDALVDTLDEYEWANLRWSLLKLNRRVRRRVMA